MTKLNFVKSAAKDYPQAGIAKGESYYWWQHYRMPRRMSKTRPKPSQIASSEYERELLGIVEELEGWEGGWYEGDRDELVSQLEQLRDYEQEKFDNMPEGFQQGDTGVMLEERVSNLDQWIDELNSIDFDKENEDETPWQQAVSSFTGA